VFFVECMQYSFRYFVLLFFKKKDNISPVRVLSNLASESEQSVGTNRQSVQL